LCQRQRGVEKWRGKGRARPWGGDCGMGGRCFWARLVIPWGPQADQRTDVWGAGPDVSTPDGFEPPQLKVKKHVGWCSPSCGSGGKTSCYSQTAEGGRVGNQRPRTIGRSRLYTDSPCPWDLTLRDSLLSRAPRLSQPGGFRKGRRGPLENLRESCLGPKGSGGLDLGAAKKGAKNSGSDGL